MAIERPIVRDLLASAERLVDLPARGDTRRHVEDERPAVPRAGRAAGDGAHAHEFLLAAPDGEGGAGVGEDEAHHVGVEGLLDDPGAHAEVVAVFYANHANAVGLGC